MYFFKTPKILKFIFYDCLWEKSTDKKELYLTFDDGPIPEVTPWVLTILEQYDAKSTFFCIGDHVRLYPQVYQSILEHGHKVGNHTFDHLNGWSSSIPDYLGNIEKAREWIESNLFRPPYGKLTLWQYLAIRKKHKIVMWSVLSGDFDTSLTPDQCIYHLKKNTNPGSIIVFHDSIQSFDLLKEVLPVMMKFWKNEGYVFKSIF